MNNTLGIPRVGLTCQGFADDPDGMLRARRYWEGIESVGAEVVPIAENTPLNALYPLVVSLDAVVFSGGCDIDPVHYGRRRDGACERADPRRDQLELALVGLVLGRNMPVLGICRGMQLLNVALGGTLLQDISGHRAENGESDAWHEIQVERGTRLGAIAGADTARVNSFHHQAVDRPGDGLIVTARAQDGTVEALELPGGRFLLAVQWHPEKSLRADALSPKIFQALRAAMH